MRRVLNVTLPRVDRSAVPPLFTQLSSSSPKLFS